MTPSKKAPRIPGRRIPSTTTGPTTMTDRPSTRKPNRDSTLASFGSSWAGLLEDALASGSIELRFGSSADRQRIRGQFYNLRKAMLNERPDLYERYLGLSTFLRDDDPGTENRFIMLIGRNHPDADLLQAASGKQLCGDWPDPPTRQADAAAELSPEPTFDPAEAALDSFLRKASGQSGAGK